MATPYADLVDTIGTCTRWYRFTSATPGTESNVGTDTTPADNIASAVGTYTAQTAGPLLNEDTSYAITFTDGYLTRTAPWGTNDFPDTDFGTISFWFKSSYSGDTQTFLSCHPDNYNFSFYLLTTGAVLLQTISGANSKSFVTDTTGLNDGNWHFFAITCTGADTNKAYVDGYEVTVTLSGSGLPNYSWISSVTLVNAMFFGNDSRIVRTPPAQIDLPLVGSLTEVQFWSNALSSTNIYDLWDSSLEPPITPNPGGTRRSFRRTYA